MTELKNIDPNHQFLQTAVVGSAFYKLPLRFFSILLIKFLQRKYKSISINIKGQQSNKVISTLQFIQYTLYFFKCQFRAWGYFHPDCCWTKEDEIFFNKLFPQKDFEELSIVVWHNPEAVTYYQNKIYKLSKGITPCYEISIKNQLIKWKNWN